MKFFVPEVASADQAMKIYQGIRTFVRDSSGAEISERRIQALRWRHDGQMCSAKVGGTFEDQTVLAILYEPHRDLYYVCTPNRGVVRGLPMLAGGPSVIEVLDFDAE